MEFYQTQQYPRRVYIKSDEGELNKLSLAFCQKFEVDPNSDDVSHVIFREKEGEDFYFPVGIVNILIAIANGCGVDVTDVKLLDKTYDEMAGSIIHEDMLDGITLRDYQLEGTHAGLYHKGGILQIPTGGGKTEMMSAVTKYILENTNGNVLIGVPSTNLLIQTYDRLLKRGIAESDISMLGGGHNIDVSKRVTVSTVQSAYNRIKKKEPDFMEWSKSITALLLDEAHHGSARTWFTIVDSIPADYVLGFSAEPFYGDMSNAIRDMLLRGTLGSILYRIPLRVLINRGFLAHPYVFAMRSMYNGNIKRLSNWQTVYKTGIVQNTLRNQMVVDVSDYLINSNKNPLILVQQINHGRHIAEELSKKGHRVAVLTGGQHVTVYDEGVIIDEYHDPEERSKQEFSDGLISALVGTQILDEGVDMPSLSSVVLAGGGKSKLKLIQRVGRGLRPKDDDNTTFIFDFTDSFNNITSRQFKERKAEFDKQQFDVYFVQDMKALDYMIQNIRKGGTP